MNLKRRKEEWEENYRSYSEGENLEIHGEAFYKDIKFDGLILDVGCGDMESVPKNYSALVGLDFSETALKLAKKNSSGDMINGIGENLPFKENSFDQVLCIETIKWLGENYRKVLEEVVRVAKDKVVLTLSHEDFLKTYCKMFNFDIKMNDNIAVYTVDNKKNMCVVFNKKGARDILTEF